ncbi:MAG: Ig-like domain-containing protein [Gemmatimonadota bacterium]
MRMLIPGTLTLVLSLTASCGGGSPTTPGGPAPVATVTVMQPATSLVAQQTLQLSAVVKDAGGSPLTGRSVTWQSTAGAVASVSSDGLVTGLSRGSTTVSATSEGKMGTATITVLDGSMVGPAGGIVIAANGNAKLTIPAGALSSPLPISVTPLPVPPLTAGVVSNTAYELGPSGTHFAQPVTLEFKYASVGIDSAQALYGLARFTGGKWVRLPGTSAGNPAHTIVATTTSFSTYGITTRSYGTGELVITPATIGLVYGQTLQLTATGYDYDGSVVPPPPGGTIWSDDGSFSAPVSVGGVVTGAVPGGPYRVGARQVYTIPCLTPCYVGSRNVGTPQQIDDYANEIHATNSGFANVLVGLVPVNSVTLSPPSTTRAVGQTVTLLPTLKDAGGTTLPLNFRTVTWSTSNSSIANVSTAGVVTAFAPGGPVTITATSGGVSGTASFTVTGGTSTVAVVIAEPSGQRVEVGTTATLIATPYDVNALPVVGKTVTWSSGTPTSAMVSAAGVVTAMVPGHIQINATVDGVTGSVFIDVIPALPLVIGSPSAGDKHACLLRSNNAIWCWGEGSYGALGNGSMTETQPLPVLVSGGTAFAALSSGGRNSCALDMTGHALCWGDFNVGIIGNSPVQSFAPTPAGGGKVFTKIAAGPFRSCGLDAGGVAWCWGQARLGDGTAQTSYTAPVQVFGHTFTALSMGWFSCGLSGGAAYCWGSAPGGSLGDGTTQSSDIPVAVTGGHSFTAISAGSGPNACGLTGSGEVWCWGQGAGGLLGDGAQVNRTTPVKVASSLVFTAISVGGSQSCALAQDQTAYCWGATNSTGSVPYNNIEGPQYRLTPVPVFGGKHFTEISSGGFHTCARASDGTWCWGGQDHGQLGFGNSSLLFGQTPTKVVFP